VVKEQLLLKTGRRGIIEEGESLLEAARKLGVELEAICGDRKLDWDCLGIYLIRDHRTQVGWCY
jgi:uncharacterized 2Fe-2S/4Fe-4S cluster protein (DUF4445 family)